MNTISLAVIFILIQGLLAAQNVGINTTDPMESLHIKSGGLLVEGIPLIPGYSSIPDTALFNDFNVPTDTSGVLYDDGGPEGPYSSGETFTPFAIDIISEPIAVQIEVTQMDLAADDSLVIDNKFVLRNGDIGSFRINGQNVFLGFYRHGPDTAAGFEIHWNALYEIDTDTIAVEGSGSRLMWVPGKRALLSGAVLNDRWDTDSIGLYSTAMGFDVQASGDYAFAAGENSVARGNGAISIGTDNRAQGQGDVAIGRNNLASSVNGRATAIGSSNMGLGTSSAALGRSNIVTGNSGSVAIGSSSSVTENFGSIAAGYSCIVSGRQGAVALGDNNNVSGFYGATAIGSNNLTTGEWGTVALGFQVEVNGGYGAMAMGNKVITNGRSSVTIGKGLAGFSGDLQNDIDNSLMIGFLSDVPTFFVGPGDSTTNSIGKVGIGTTAPDTRLHVIGTDNNGTTATLKIESGSQSMLLDGNEIDATVDDLHLQNNAVGDVILVDGGGKVGIGTSDPGSVVSNSRLDVSSGHILLDNNFGVFAANSAGTGLGTGFDSGTGDQMDLWAGGDARMTLLANGNVGIGTTNPDRDLTIFDVDGGGSAVLNVKDATRELFLGVNSSGVSLRSLTNHDLSFWTNNARHMTIGTNGNVGIGTTNPAHPLHIQKNGIADQQTIAMVLESPVSERPVLLFSENGATLDLNDGMSIEYDGSGSGSTNLLRFNKIGGSAAMTIENGGEIGVNIAAPAATLHVVQLSSDAKGLRVEHPTNGNYWDIGLNSQHLKFSYNDVLKASIDEGDGSYIQASDRNLKEDIRPLPPVLQDVVQLIPSSYRMKGAKTHQKSIGLIAQDVELHFPELVKDLDEYTGVNYSGVAVLAIQAIKEQQLLIDQLQTQNAELLKRVEAMERKTSVSQSRDESGQ